MALPLYLAMTAAEIGTNTALPRETAYMACHFSPYGTGLSNLPGVLPPGGMVMVNDRIPYWGHDAGLVTEQLAEVVEKFTCSGVLLDFQRPGVGAVAALAERVVAALPCPVGVALPYADGLSGPVFLPPVPLDEHIGDYLRPWQDREIWLEMALVGLEIVLTEDGAATVPLSELPNPGPSHRDNGLHCHYQIETDRAARFSLYRTRKDLETLLCQAQDFGVTLGVGLWQEFREK